ncbi:MAG: epoxyqueuosine reductase, partial [Clostridiales bacterium]|nr:epoxyqueuosine reductase [Clostridiales bacterium]
MMISTSNNIIEQIHNHGLRAKLIPVSHFENIKQEYEEVQNNNPFVAKYLNSYFEEFNYEPSSIMSNPQSLLIVAVPDTITRMYFNLNGRKHAVLMPPMYLFNSSVKNEKNIKKIVEINSLLEKILSPYSLESHKINLPAKLLAVKSGLGVYGKNNICYVEGLGSFMWLGV